MLSNICFLTPPAFLQLMFTRYILIDLSTFDLAVSLYLKQNSLLKTYSGVLIFVFFQSDNLYSKLEFFIHFHLKYLLIKLGLLPLAYHFFPLIFPSLFVFFFFFFIASFGLTNILFVIFCLDSVLPWLLSH